MFDFDDDSKNSFEIEVEPLPAVNPPSVLEVCSESNIQDPFPQDSFDLTLKEAEISGNAIVPQNLEFTYFESQADMDNNVNPIEDPTSYTNISHPQSIFVRVIDNSTNQQCYETTVLTLSVLPLPSPSETNPDILRLITVMIIMMVLLLSHLT